MLPLTFILLLFLNPLVRSGTVTSYFERETVTADAFGVPSASASLETNLVPVTPTGDNPSAIETISTFLSRAPGIDYEKVVLASGEGERQTDLADGIETHYDHYVLFTLTKASGCTYSAPPVVTAVVSVSSVSMLQSDRDAASPTSAETYTKTDAFLGLSTQVSVHVDAFLDPAELPPMLQDRTRTRAYPLAYDRCDRHYYGGDGDFSMCDTYYDGFRSAPIGGGYECSNGKFHTWGLLPWKVAVVVLAAWVGFTLALGFIQAARQFRQMMVGEKARRGLPTAFCWVIPLLGLPLLYFHHRIQPRFEEDRTTLKQQWADMPFKTKFSLFWKYGFSNEYPPILGSPPERVQASRPSAPPRRSTTHQLEEAEPPPPPYSAEGPPKYSEEESR